MAPDQNEQGFNSFNFLGRNFNHTPNFDEFRRLSRKATINSALPDSVDQVGSTSNPIIADIFNNNLAPSLAYA